MPPVPTYYENISVLKWAKKISNHSILSYFGRDGNIKLK
jgi:hypothetical protein